MDGAPADDGPLRRRRARPTAHQPASDQEADALAIDWPEVDCISAIHKQRAVKVSDDGDHEKWRCTCEGEERHQTYVPRHRQLTTSTTNKIYKQMIDCPLFGKDWL